MLIFAKQGKDIVCAGVSAVSVGAINAVHALTGVSPEIEQGEDGGYLRCVFRKIFRKNKEKVQLLLEGWLFHYKRLNEDYGKYIKITLKSRRWNKCY